MDKQKLRTTWQSSEWSFSRQKKLYELQHNQSTLRFQQQRIKTEPKETLKKFTNPTSFHEYVQLIEKKYRIQNLSKPKRKVGNGRSLVQICSTKSLVLYESLPNLLQIN
ncbi:unnamed protein product (macronuclear) [Paramecium tetraurelia]|uniref:Uncharacterized protein n=1 Tax=Paramecium tetraurelia TaxID=5888 RepID=A0BDM1_PARTE|nr:uncharacterized protein GSPATT00027667001 [Paramecium tetraurelia]CAK56638.1 unnamed protein product [Paramecium tetraurelia]|eukprot:XP_001424036.1 hypothetical protein (macronuclear) [Paramecium tetraurelia strain d4-2]